MEVNRLLTTPQKQELANALSHGLGVLLGLVGTPLLLIQAYRTSNAYGIAGSAVFCFCLLLVFTASTAYHIAANPAVKHALRVLDHISIYFKIAGTYTPFILLFAFEGIGQALFWALWGLTLLGIVFKILLTNRFEKLSVGIYLAMGWSVVVLPSSFFAQISGPILWFIIAGGLSYTLGVVFYAWKKMTYHHAIWHLWVLIGSLCHYTAVFIAVSRLPL